MDNAGAALEHRAPRRDDQLICHVLKCTQRSFGAKWSVHFMQPFMLAVL